MLHHFFSKCFYDKKRNKRLALCLQFPHQRTPHSKCRAFMQAWSWQMKWTPPTGKTCTCSNTLCHYMKHWSSRTSECWEGNEHAVERLFGGVLSHLPPPRGCDVILHMSERDALCDEEVDEDARLETMSLVKPHWKLWSIIFTDIF